MSIITTMTRNWLTRSVQPFHFKREFSNTLNYKEERNLGLYVHIPFCRTLCGFCPYCKVLYEKELAIKYVKALMKEIDLVGSTYEGKKQVTSLYFGGGTPALISEEIGRIIQKIKEYYIVTEGIGLELHPVDVTVEKLLELKRAGVTKISIGIQSFQKDYLETLGREEVDYNTMFDALKKVTFETVSMDFIFALPNQTIEKLKKDIETAFYNGANHIAIYPFIDFTFTNRNFSKMTRKATKELLYDILSYCKEKGYVRDSIWTFSKEGDSKYSSMTRDNFLGFGCSATTLLKDIFKINTFSIDGYLQRIKEGNLATALTLEFTRRQRMVYYLFWTAYTLRISGKDFFNFFGKKLEHNYGLELWIASVLGFVKKENGQYLITEKGSYYYHYYENFYTLSYIDHMWHSMKKEAFPSELIIK